MTSEEHEVVDLIFRYGMIDGAHHKQWLLDQILRILGDREGMYEEWIEEYNSDEDYDEWDVGVPP